MGPEFTLLRFDPSVEVAPLEAAARRRGVPLTVLDVDGAAARGLYGHRLVLSRPDQHVAWRGDALPSDPVALIDRVRGAADSAIAASRSSSLRTQGPIATGVGGVKIRVIHFA